MRGRESEDDGEEKMKMMCEISAIFRMRREATSGKELFSRFGGFNTEMKQHQSKLPRHLSIRPLPTFLRLINGINPTP